MPGKNDPFPLPHEIYPKNWFSRLKREDLFQGDLPLEIDLGCGDGTFLADLSEHFSERNFLGVERLLGRVRKVSRKATARDLQNLKILRADSNYAVEWLLPLGCARRIHFLCPDPWPKKKHARRRQMCQLPFLKSLHGLLEPDGELLFMTDALSYYEEAMEVQEGCDFFEILPWKEDQFFYPKTDFEKQWLAEGKAMNRMRLKKT